MGDFVKVCSLCGTSGLRSDVASHARAGLHRLAGSDDGWCCEDRRDCAERVAGPSGPGDTEHRPS